MSQSVEDKENFIKILCDILCKRDEVFMHNLNCHNFEQYTLKWLFLIQDAIHIFNLPYISLWEVMSYICDALNI